MCIWLVCTRKAPFVKEDAKKLQHRKLFSECARFRFSSYYIRKAYTSGVKLTGQLVVYVSVCIWCALIRASLFMNGKSSKSVWANEKRIVLKKYRMRIK